jgi:hypothetical protein
MGHSHWLLLVTILASPAVAPPALAQGPAPGSRYLSFGVGAVHFEAVRISATGPAVTGAFEWRFSPRWAVQLEIARNWPASYENRFVTPYYYSTGDPRDPRTEHIQVDAPGVMSRKVHADISGAARFQATRNAPVEFAFLLGAMFRLESVHGAGSVPVSRTPQGIEMGVIETRRNRMRMLFMQGAEVAVPVSARLAIVVSGRVAWELPVEDPDAVSRAAIALRCRF